jgi:hypothetical protein
MRPQSADPKNQVLIFFVSLSDIIEVLLGAAIDPTGLGDVVEKLREL